MPAMESSESALLLTICALGFISLFKFFIKIVSWIWIMFLRPPKDLKEYGSWALVTGSTDGIGKALAMELASKGLNLVLVGRNPSKLEATTNEILQLNARISVRSIVVDFAKLSGEEIGRAIGEGIRDVEIGILVNNVGMAYPYPRYFHEVDVEMAESMVRVNVEATTWVTRAVLPTMMKRKRGAIVNIGSGSSVVLPSYPLYTVYAASKAYVAMFSKCLNLEYKQHGIDVQCQIPLLVATKMASIKRSSLFVPSPETYSKASIRAIGGSECISMPYWAHSLQWGVLCLCPEEFANWCTLRYFLGFRKRGQMKEAKMKQHQ